MILKFFRIIIQNINIKKEVVKNKISCYNKKGGNMPNSKVKLIQAWTLIHKDELMANWQLAQNSETLYNINPLN